MTTTLAVRLDSAGDVLVTGPALRALAHGSDRLVLAAGPRGAGVAPLLPGVDQVVTWRAGWIDPEPLTIAPADIHQIVSTIAAVRADQAVIFTSFHQSPLPTALVLRLAGIPHIAAISEDYPGTLLDVRHRTTDDQPEPERALGLARAAGFDLAPVDDGRLAVNAGVAPGRLPPRYVVLHPGTSVPARAWSSERWIQAREALVEAGRTVVVTGDRHEQRLTAEVAGRHAIDWGGRTAWGQLAAVMQGADAVVVANTGPAHLAAAVGTPVVSLFAPTVPAIRWAPYGVPTVLLGDQHAACAGTRATRCPVPGHPCLDSVTAADVVSAVQRLAPAVRGVA